jgi:hypothetical protein
MKGRVGIIPNDAVQSIVEQLLASFSPVKESVWIGGSKVAGVWTWSNGLPVSYAQWGGTEPTSGPGEDLMSITAQNHHLLVLGDWNNEFSTSQFPYLLEFGYTTDPTKADTDGDGFDDKVESLAGTDPNNPNDPTPGLSTGLIAFYRFDGNADDSLGNQPPLTLFGSWSFISDSLSGGALRTDGDRSIWYSGGGYFSPAFLENRNLTAATFVF